MKTMVSICMVLVLALALAACGGGNDSNGSGGSSSSGCGGSSASGPDFSSPKATMTELAAGFAASDIEKILACYDKDHLAAKRQDGKTNEEKMRAEMKELSDEGSKITIKFEEADITIEGDKAKVKTTMTFTMKDGKTEEESEGFELVKKGDTWKCVK
jgi:ketosteroid isomerase-like protein